MAIFKCKMCGGSLEVQKGQTICECEYCGTKQTVSATDDEIVTNLYNRANNLRIKCEFDTAQEIYEKIVAKNSNEAGAYWGIVLCKYGIEYVEDPKTYKRVPTCHRTQLESVLTDVDYLSAIENADSNQKLIYEQEAKEIDKLQKDILSIVHNEKPFDVFICYKETDENGKRTVDSVLANDIYYQLMQEGLKVFYAAITLENKLGQEYEPYIFSALNSAKVMLVVGTKPENFNAVWVKNEWSRYLKLMSNDRSKTLIPCFRDMDAYDLPDEFSHLQAQDMSKIGFINDVVRGIKKLIAPAKEQPTNTVVVESNNTDIAPLLKRAFIFLEDGNWKDADEYCERVLDLDPECAMAYLGKLMAELKVNKQDDLAKLEIPFNENDNYKKAIRYADNKLSEKLNQYIKDINYAITKKTYDAAVEQLNTATTSQQYLDVSLAFLKLEDFLDSKDLYNQCIQKAEVCQKDEKYNIAKGLMSSKSYKTAIDYFNEILGWKDTQEQIDICNQKIKELEAKEKQKEEKLRIVAEKSAKKRKKYVSIFVPIVCVCAAFVIILNAVIIPNNKYNAALKLLNEGNEDSAYSIFAEMESYKDSNKKMSEIMKPYFISQKQFIAAGSEHIVGLKDDGTVVAVGDNYYGECDVSNWKDIVAVSAGVSYTVGLKSDGRVVAAGYSKYGQCDVSNWKDIVAISAGDYHTVGLKNDGTVVAAGINNDGRCDVSKWKDIVAVSAGTHNTVGLKSDGTVVAVGNNDKGQCEVQNWNSIIAVSVSDSNTVGLKKDGTVIGAGEYFSSEIYGWKNISNIYASSSDIIGLKNDGTVLSASYSNYGHCDFSNWKDIVAVSTGAFYAVGLKSDGTVVAEGDNDYGQCDVSDWNNIKTKY